MYIINKELKCMKKRIIKVGDVVCIDSLALQPAEIIVDSEDYFKKTINVDNELVPGRTENGESLGASLIFKYLGAGKFQEMVTGKIFISDGFVNCKDYELVDKDNVIFEDNKQYCSNEEFQKDFCMLKENPVVISTKGRYVYELDDESKNLYLMNTDNIRVKTILDVEKQSREFFETSVDNMINRDAICANLDNEVEDFRRKK